MFSVKFHFCNKYKSEPNTVSQSVILEELIPGPLWLSGLCGCSSCIYKKLHIICTQPVSLTLYLKSSLHYLAIANAVPVPCN